MRPSAPRLFAEADDEPFPGAVVDEEGVLDSVEHGGHGGAVEKLPNADFFNGMP